VYWWSSTDDPSVSVNISQQKLERYFEEKGTQVLNPSQIYQQAKPEIDLQGFEPSSDNILRTGALAGADLVLIGKSDLRFAEGRQLTSLVSVQCDMSGRLIDVRTGAVVVQAATFSLGIHVDKSSATMDAVDKAAKQLCEQLLNKVYFNIRSMNEYKLELSFDKSSGEAEVRGWIDSFLKIFNEMEVLSVENDNLRHLWIVKIRTQVESADILQTVFETGCDGFQTDVVSVNDNIINLKIQAE
jgi:hypothetical protein